MDERRLRPIVQIVNSLRPDLVVITGDIINWGALYLEETARVLSEIKARLGVYAIMGNHDFYCDIKIFSEMLQKASIKLLRNSWEVIGRSETAAPVYLIGIDDPRGSWYFNKRLPVLEEIITGIPAAGFKILLSHRPNIFNDAVKKGIHLTLAGHTHGGQIILPFPGGRPPSLARLAYLTDYGLYQKAKSYLYVNRGLGVVGPPIRINCPQEITCLDLRER
jgi:predicted MPP superfamily phosphohydrolase